MQIAKGRARLSGGACERLCGVFGSLEAVRLSALGALSRVRPDCLAPLPLGFAVRSPSRLVFSLVCAFARLGGVLV